MLRLFASNTHLYAGARGTSEHVELEGGDIPEGAEPAVVVFSDGSMASATLDDDILSVQPYRTAAATDIGPKRWRISRHGKDWRVTRALPRA